MSVRTLIIPDIHLKYQVAQTIIDREQCDVVLHLGDHQDNHGDCAANAVDQAEWTKSRLDAGDIILLGNHDLPYWFYHPLHDCPGWEPDKHRAIQPILSEKDRRKFRLWVELEGWLFSHAGFPPYHAGHIGEEPLYLEKLWRGQTDPLIYSSHGRMCREPIDGVVWMDWDQLVPLEGINQCVGHTPSSMPRRKRTDTSDNIALDTGLRHYGVLEDGQITIKDRKGTVIR